ncbi:MAG: flagellar hook capping FlgD N-terminal domain-containing protein [Dissulfurispiraceae bacterium]|jgi:flagellar basal-body rod modification protein FlgD|nr:flagellar hook capping FlgD N-terminal domain-containing protein [Dissulfurispiraceae bacterium]
MSGYSAPIFNDPYYTTSASEASAAQRNSALLKDDFLKLLVTQLKNQDPLDPMDNTEFVSQLATFSSLEQISNMSGNLEKFIANQNYQNATIAASVIGKEITSVTGETGVVKSISIETDGVFLQVNESKIPFAAIQTIKNPE